MNFYFSGMNYADLYARLLSIQIDDSSESDHSRDSPLYVYAAERDSDMDVDPELDANFERSEERRRQKTAERKRRQRKFQRELLNQKQVITPEERKKNAARLKRFRDRQRMLSLPKPSTSAELRQYHAQRKKRQRKSRQHLITSEEKAKHAAIQQRYRDRKKNISSSRNEIEIKYGFYKFLHHLLTYVLDRVPDITLLPLLYHITGRLGRTCLEKKRNLYFYKRKHLSETKVRSKTVT